MTPLAWRHGRTAALERGWTPGVRLVVMIAGGSLLATLPVLTSTPLLPPVGFLALVLWRLLAPELLPPWKTLPFALLDDLVSGNPLGTALFLWPLAALVIPWLARASLFRSWRQDWWVTSVAGVVYQGALWLLSPLNGGSTLPHTALAIPAALSVLCVPALVRLATGPGRPEPRRS